MRKQSNRNKSAFMIIGGSILAAAWMIVGPDILEPFNMPFKVVDLLVFIPSMIIMFWIISGNKSFMACEYRAWRRLFNRN
ncbi:MAG: hypothetical protein JKX72_06755 [Robiginitomaculum sp.]|nr:hypothetical protein [Robiginitomaculum sp.]